MLQQITIQTSNPEYFKPVVESALRREVKLIERAIERTRAALALFEAPYHRITDELEQKFKARELAETLDFLDWWMETEALRHLEARRQLLQATHLE
jgi:hypothetical protein